MFVGGIQSVQAHGYIVRSIPEDRAVLERSPARLQYWFSESLEPEFSKLTVSDEAGNVVAEGGVDEDNLSLLKVRLPTDLPDGAYFAELRTAFASDGHVIVETRVFFIGEAVAGVSGTAASDQAVPLEVVWRGLVLASTTVLLGTFVVYVLVLVPAWGNPRYPAGLLPPRVMRRLNWIVMIALVMAISANILALIQQTMVFFGADVERVFSDQLWRIVRSGTTFGDMWNPRMFLLLLVGGLQVASIHFRKEQPQAVRAFWVANMWAVILIVATWSASSHAAGSPLWPWVALINDWLHGLAVGFWAGGLVTLVLVLPIALQPYTTEQRRAALNTVLRRFSRLAIVCVVLVIGTGIYSASNWIYTPSMAVSTYGGSLLLKIVLVSGLLLLGALHHITLRPEKYARWQAISQRVKRFLPTLGLESVLALIVLTSVGLLSATPIPEPEAPSEPVQTPSGFVSTGDYTVQLSLAPGGPGINTYDAIVRRNSIPVDDVSVYLQMINPDMDDRGDWHQLEAFGEGLFSAAGDEIDTLGTWWTIIDVEDTSGMERLAFTWDITDEASVDLFRDPALINIFAMVGALGAVGFVLYSPVQRFYVHQLRPDLNVATVTIAVMATVSTVVILIGGWMYIQQTMREVDLAMNPPPTMINSQVPDQASVDRGQQIFVDACSAWQSVESENRTSLEQLSSRQDEEIFLAIRDGWRDLPSCDDGLSTDSRWHVVNYIHTFENRD